MKVLLDTCTLSELRRPKPDAGVRSAVEAVDADDLFVSVLSIGEITKGIGLLKDSRNKRDLQVWLETIERAYGDRLVAVDVETCRIWGELTANARKVGRVLPAVDGLIAATAQQHGLHLMTRNTADFEHTGIQLMNPWREAG